MNALIYRAFWVMITCSLITACGTTVGNGLDSPPSDAIPNANPSITPSSGSGVNFYFSAFAGSRALSRRSFLQSTVSRVIFCVKRLRFKISSSSGGDHVDLSLQELSLLTNGTFLVNAEIPARSYTRIEIDLDKVCTSGKSVQLTNGHGNFSTEDSVTIKFEGNFTIVGSGQNLSLDIQPIVNELANVTDSNKIKEAME